MSANVLDTGVSNQLWTLEEAAEYLGIPRKTLYQWRYKNSGPPSHRIGRHVRYVPSEVLAWVKEQF